MGRGVSEIVAVVLLVGIVVVLMGSIWAWISAKTEVRETPVADILYLGANHPGPTGQYGRVWLKHLGGEHVKLGEVRILVENLNPSTGGFECCESLCPDSPEGYWKPGEVLLADRLVDNNPRFCVNPVNPEQGCANAELGCGQCQANSECEGRIDAFQQGDWVRVTLVHKPSGKVIFEGKVKVLQGAGIP